MCLPALQLWNIYIFWESHKSTAFSYLAKLFANVFQEGFVGFFLPFFTCVPCDMHVSVAWVCVCWCVCMWHACVCVHGLVCADMCVSGMHMSMCMSLYIVICVHEALMCPCALVYISVKLYCIAQLCSRHN